MERRMNGPTVPQRPRKTSQKSYRLMVLPHPQASEALHIEISPQSLVTSGETEEPRQGQSTPTVLLVTCGSLYFNLTLQVLQGNLWAQPLGMCL